MTEFGRANGSAKSLVQEMAPAKIQREWKNPERGRRRLARQLARDEKAWPFVVLIIASYLCSVTSSNSPAVDAPTQSQPGVSESAVDRASGASETRSMTPAEAIEWFLDHKRNDVTEGTCESYRKSLEYFVEFCEQFRIEYSNDLTGRDLEAFRKWRREESATEQLKRKTMRDQMYLLRDCLRYLVSIEAVPAGLHEKVVIPKLGPGDGISEVRLEQDRANRILSHLRKFEYASLEHVFWHLLGVTGRRISGLRSLDVDDYYPEASNPYLAFRHRPEQGTRLKNGTKGETNVNIDGETKELLDDYLETVRPEAVDDHGRRPLLATDQGRLTTSTMRKYCYKWSRPCKVGVECPHERTVADCEAAQQANQASKCPSSISPHAVRHGYISSMLDAEVPKQILSGRCDVSEPVIDQHYDNRSEAERQDLRKRIFDDVFGDGRSGYLN